MNVRPGRAGDIPAVAAILAANKEPMDWPDQPELGWPYLVHLVARARTAVAEVDEGGFREISYRCDGAIGVVTFRFYNGAMSSSQSRRLETALRHAVAQDTRVLLLRAGQPFSNGIHLGVIEAAADPASESPS